MTIDPRKTRGFLNHNPGNLNRNPTLPWQGEVQDPADGRLTDFQRRELASGRFAVFLSPEWGIRAMAKNLQAYRSVLGLRSVRDMIGRWAPPSENDTGSYVASVAAKLGVSPDGEVEMTYRTLHALCDAIIRVECGGMPYRGNEIEDGLRLAGLVKPVTLVTSTTSQAAAVSTTATAAGAGLSVLQEPLRGALDALAPHAGSNRTFDALIVGLQLAVAAIAVGGICWMLWQRIKRQRRDDRIESAGAVDAAGTGT